MIDYNNPFKDHKKLSLMQLEGKEIERLNKILKMHLASIRKLRKDLSFPIHACNRRIIYK